MSVSPGSVAVDCTFLRPDGTSVPLSAFAAPALVVVFLRHLACISCRAHLDAVRQRYDDIRRLGAEVLAVSFSRPERVAAYLARYPLPFPVVCDPDREAYRAFGLKAASLGTFLRGHVIAHYLKLMFRGWWVHKPDPGDDVFQLGGNFVLDRQLRLHYAHVCEDPSDRPDPETLVAVVRNLTAGSAKPAH